MKQNHLIISLCSINLLAIILLAIFCYSNTRKIVYVDSIRLLKNYKGMESVRKELNARSDSYKANLDTLRMEIEKVVALADQSKNGNTQSKQIMEELVRSKQQAYLNYEQVVGEKVKQQDQELSVKLVEKVNDYLKRYGKSKGYNLILAATPYGNIAFGADVVDITDQVLEGLNKEYK